MVQCSDNSLYTGITTDINRRVNEHNSSSQWAKYTKARRPVTLIYSEEATSRSEAAKREIAIKKLSRLEKEKLLKFL